MENISTVKTAAEPLAKICFKRNKRHMALSWVFSFSHKEGTQRPVWPHLIGVCFGVQNETSDTSQNLVMDIFKGKLNIYFSVPLICIFDNAFYCEVLPHLF